MSDFEAARALVADTVRELGCLDILVNNASIPRERMIYNMSESEWDDVVRVHLSG